MSFSEILKLATPVVFSYLGLMVMGLVDLLFVGRVGAVAIGAVGLGTAITSWLMVFGIGLLTSLDYLVSHAYGAGRPKEGAAYLAQATWLSVAMGIPLTALSLLIAANPSWIGVEGEVAVETHRYVSVLSYSLAPSFLFACFRQYLQAHGHARAAMVVMIVANVINALGNYLFVFGKAGFPAMGVVGSAWATTIARYFMAFAMMAVVFVWDRRENGGLLKQVSWRFDGVLSRKITQLGFPAAMQMVLEVGVFGAATALAARFSAGELAAHQIVLNYASMMFMVPLGISSAAAVLVGQMVGRKDFVNAAIVGWKCLRLGIGFMGASCAFMLIFPGLILSVYTNDQAVIEAGKNLLLIAAFFQLSDGAQVVATGVLRGVADTRSSMLANLFGHWFLGLPLGAALGFYWGFGLRGLWIGLSVGLTLIAISLVLRWASRSREPIGNRVA